MATRDMKVGQWSKTRKIYNGVCGSRHEISYGYVYDSDLDARVKYWIGLDAFDQRSLTGTGGPMGVFGSGDYLRDNAANHSVRVRVSKLPLDEDGNRIGNFPADAEEVHDTVFSGDPKGTRKIYFDINEPAEYLVKVSNESTGNCSGGKCKEGTEVVEGVFGNEREISNCWYDWGWAITVPQDEFERIEQSQEMSFTNPSRVQSGNPQADSGLDENIILIGGIGLSLMIILLSGS